MEAVLGFVYDLAAGVIQDFVGHFHVATHREAVGEDGVTDGDKPKWD